MLTKPDVGDDEIASCLDSAYGLKVKEVSFLPLGADFRTVVYRIKSLDEKDYFLKLRSGDFLAASVRVPKYLKELGLEQAIPPYTTVAGGLWADLGSYKVILYPYVEGHNGVDVTLTGQQWIQFGDTLKRLHFAQYPKLVTKGVPREDFICRWCEVVKEFLKRAEVETFTETVQAEMVSLLKSQRQQILTLISRVEELSLSLKNQSLPYVLCHADIHGWNLHIDNAKAIYIVDWDTLIFAPPERDLMFIGAGIHETGRAQAEEEALFYQGYGSTKVNWEAVAYYRYARVLEDIGEYCRHIFLSQDSKENRLQSLDYAKANFIDEGTIERARKSDPKEGYS